MNFYFCETCGKRITDDDIAGGLGRNKKLKGVFCAQCAVGVMTLEMQPIKEEDLKPPAAPIAARTTLVKPARASTPLPDKSDRSTAPTPVRRNAILYTVAGTLGAVLLVGIVIFFSHKTRATRVADEPQKPESPPPAEAAPKATTVAAPVSTTPAAQPIPPQPAPLPEKPSTPVAEPNPPVSDPVPVQEVKPAPTPAANVPAGTEPKPETAPPAKESPEDKAREEAAAAAWNDIGKLADAKQWRNAKKSIDAFSTNFTSARFCTEHKHDIEALGAKAGELAALQEPQQYAFQTDENYAQFQQVFSGQPYHMDVRHDKGMVVVSSKQNGSKYLYIAKAITLGTDFDLRFKLNLHVSASDAANSTKETHRESDFNVCFIDPARQDKPRNVSPDYPRFSLHVSSSHSGSLATGLLNRGQDFTAKGESASAGVFDGIKKTVPGGPNYLKDGKARAPASADGEYLVVMSMHGQHMKITINGMDAIDSDLPAGAVECISKSPLALHFNLLGIVHEIWLEELDVRTAELERLQK